MKEPIEVKEYQTIVSKNKVESKTNGILVVDEVVFDEVKLFIENFQKTENVDDVHNFVSLLYQKKYGFTIKFKNYVGMIQLSDGTQFNILPKIDFAGEDTKKNEDIKNEKTKETFLYMLQSLKNFPGKSFTSAVLNVAQMPLFEIFIHMYLQEAWNLVKQGIRSSYVHKEDNLHCFKGKLLLAQHLRHNLMHQERFYVAFDDYNINRPENKLIKATLLILQRITVNTDNSRSVKQLLTYFDSVDASTNYVKDFQNVIKNRETRVYTDLISWTRFFLFNLNQTFTPFAGTQSAKSFLFPMEQVFESYIAKHIKQVFTPKDGWHVSCQEEKYYLIEGEEGKSKPEYEPRRFGLRPDIVLRKEVPNSPAATFIMDTKWKRLSNKKKNYGVNQSDMYQMFAYAKRYEKEQVQSVWLLYPNSEDSRDFKKRLELFDDTVIRIFSVDVVKERIINSLNDLKEEVENELAGLLSEK